MQLLWNHESSIQKTEIEKTEIEKTEIEKTIKVLAGNCTALAEKVDGSKQSGNEQTLKDEFAKLKSELRYLQLIPVRSWVSVAALAHFMQSYALRFLFDGGLLLSKLSTSFDKDVLIRWVAGEKSAAYTQHSQMRDIQENLNNIAQKLSPHVQRDHSVMRDLCYWSAIIALLFLIPVFLGPFTAHFMFISRDVIGKLGVLSFLFSAPLWALYTIAGWYFFKLMQIAVVGNRPEEVILASISSVKYRAISIIRSLQLLSFSYRGSEDSWKVGKNKLLAAINPRGVDWWVFFQGVFVTFMDHATWMVPVLMHYRVNVNLLFWVISASVYFVGVMIQTLEEEIMFRSPLLQQKQSVGSLIINAVGSSLFFAVVHMSNPEFSALGNGWYPHLANLLGYFFYGLQTALMTYVCGGLEFAWGMHFANNFMLAVFVGYWPTPCVTMPLVTLYRGEGSETNSFFLSINTLERLFWYTASLFMGALGDYVKIYLRTPVRDFYPVDAVLLDVSKNNEISEENHVKTRNPIDETVENWCSSLSASVQSLQSRYVGLRFAIC